MHTLLNGFIIPNLSNSQLPLLLCSHFLVMLAECLSSGFNFAHLFNGAFDHVPRHKHRILLPHPYRSCNGLVLDARVPLWLDDEDAIRRSDIQAVSGR
jgi:hypothetical protein